ncbi:hypothetical protein FRB99_006933 [Tulasnella sp. 403]|nr:hypothetical protein FRB99_006933 [Tulasnella sp. 403]
MVFANLSQADKEAFFSLLDEYFATRGGVAAVAAAKGPVGQAAFNRLSSSDGLLKSNVGAHLLGGRTSPSASTNEPAQVKRDNTGTSAHGTPTQGDSSIDTTRPSFSALRGAFATAQNSSAFQTIGGSFKSPAAGGKSPSRVPPPVAPRANVSAAQSTPPPPAPIPIPTGPLDDDRPPPVVPRRMAPAIPHVPSGLVSGKPPPAPTPPEPEPEEQPAPEESDETWVEALYDYTSDDKNDLQFVAGERIRLIEHTSDDWWTGEKSGKQGLLPASYVKVIG